jgi:hypothetical protein
MDVSAVLKDAWSSVEKAGVPEAIQPMAFREAMRLLAPDGPATGAANRAGAASARGSTRRAAASGDSDDGGRALTVTEDEIYERVVRNTGADRGKLEEVVHLDDDGLRVSLPGLKLGRNNADRTRAVAQILTITRGFGLEESDTPLEVIRTECNRLKVYDAANFSTQISKLNGFVVSGSGQTRRLRAKSPGIQSFPALLDALATDS